MSQAKCSSIDVIAWKAKVLGVSYGELSSRVSASDLETYTEEYLAAKGVQFERLRKEAQIRQKQRGEISFKYPPPLSR